MLVLNYSDASFPTVVYLSVSYFFLEDENGASIPLNSFFIMSKSIDI